VLEALALHKQTFAGAMKHLGLITVGNLMLSWLGLVFQRGRHRRKQNRNRKASSVSENFAPEQGVDESKVSGGGSPIRVPTKVRL